MVEVGPVRPRLDGHDRFFLEQEEDGTTMNVGALVRFEQAEPEKLVEDLRELMAGRIHRMPRLRQRLVDVGLADAPPVWVDDETFRFDRAVQALPLDRPPDYRDVVALTGQIVAEPLPRDRFLWDLSVIPETTFGESIAIARWHHALVDGMSTVEFGKLLFSPTADHDVETPQPWQPDRSPPPGELAAESLAVAADDQLRAALERTARDADIDTKLADAERFLEGVISFVDLGAPPENPFPASGSSHRRYAFADVDAAALNTIRKRFDVTLEAAVHTVLAGAVERLLQARGRSLDAFRVLLPVARISRSRSALLGNHSSFNIVDLPIGEMEAQQRAAQVAHVLADARNAKQAEAAASLIRGAAALPPNLSRRLGTWMNERSFVHAVVSYMRGPRRTLYLAGRELAATYPVLPRTKGLGLLVGVMNLGGTVAFSLVADPRAVPELDFLATRIEAVARDFSA